MPLVRTLVIREHLSVKIIAADLRKLRTQILIAFSVILCHTQSPPNKRKRSKKKSPLRRGFQTIRICPPPFPQAYACRYAHRIPHTIKAWRILMDDLGKDRGQILPCYRMGCAPRSNTQQFDTNCCPLLASEKEKFLFFRNKNLAPVLTLDPYTGA